MQKNNSLSTEIFKKELHVKHDSLCCITPCDVIYGGLKKSPESGGLCGVTAPSLLKMANQWLWNGN